MERPTFPNGNVGLLAPPARLELTTLRLGGARSIQVSYGGLLPIYFTQETFSCQAWWSEFHSGILEQSLQQSFIRFMVQFSIPFDVRSLAAHTLTRQKS